jgi:hypothetical protein
MNAAAGTLPNQHEMELVDLLTQSLVSESPEG